MSWTSHDQFFGWIHSFRFNRNNYIFGGKIGLTDRPYPVIVNNPTVAQTLSNWNYADTGLVLSFFLLGLLWAKRVARREFLNEGIIEQRMDYKRYHRIITVLGLALAVRNSQYRL